ncbi:MAG: hypothetical protein JW934_14935 [Anaerolineae bacterium]|nr:hypothetical protein [Anaerolineae bacterium]
MKHGIKIWGVMLLMLLACRIQIGPAPSPSPCSIESLLLDETFFHKDFYQTSVPSKDGAPMRFGINKIGTGFTSNQYGGATQEVYEGSDAKETRERFAENIATGYDFSSREGWTDWYIPDTFDYQSLVADQFRFRCYKHKASGVETCQAVGQYGVYLIKFEADMSPILTYQDLERMLQGIDDKAAQCLGK